MSDAHPLEIRQFADYLRVEKGFSEHTMRAYLADLAQFCDYVKHGPKAIAGDAQHTPATPSLSLLRRARRNDVRAFLAHVQTAGGSARTSARKLASIRAAYKFFVRMGDLDANPGQTVRSPKLPRSLPDMLSIPEVTALIEAPDTSQPLGVRDRAILETLYSTGVRANELATLVLPNVDFSKGMVIVLGKRKKE